MSSGRRRPRSNRNRRGGLPATPTSEDFDDCPLAIWAYFSAKRPRQRKNNNTPQKRRAAPRPAPPPAEVINLEDVIRICFILIQIIMIFLECCRSKHTRECPNKDW